MSPTDPSPRVWTADELAEHRRAAIDHFIAWWQATGNVAYQGHFRDAHTVADGLFARTDDLLSLTAEALAKRDRVAREVVRYLAGPPLSGDDVDVLLNAEGAAHEQNPRNLEELVLSVIDPLRFPWCSDRASPRPPTDEERRVALKWIAGLIAAQKAATARRIGASRRQEEAVEAALSSAPLRFQKVQPRGIDYAADFLTSGQFCRQSLVGGTRADFSIGLRHHLLVLECTVSNSEGNSYKRLIHEVGKKASRWRVAFGRSVIPAAVLDGVFKLENLQKAQASEISPFWEYDLRSLVDFVATTR